MDDIEMDDDETDDNAIEYPLHILLTKKLPINELAKSQFVKKGKISDRVLENLLSDDSDDANDANVNDQNINSDEEEDFETMTMRRLTLRRQILMMMSPNCLILL